MLLAGLALIGSPLPVPPAAADAPVRVEAQVRQRLAAEGRVRVLVTLRLPSGDHTPEGRLPTAAAIALQRSDIANAQTQVVSRLGPRAHRLLHRYRTVPVLALEVGPAALAELEAASSHVAAVVEDKLSQPLLANSIPIVEADDVWAAGFDGSGTVVAVLDTGVDAAHPFLAGKVVEEACYSSTVAGTSTTFCPDGTDEQIGPGAAAPCPLGVCSHGTHVAGIAAGNGDGAGQSFSGVARGAAIMAVQVFSEFDCNGSPCAMAWNSDLIMGLEQVYERRSDHNIVAANMSLGGGLHTSPCDDDPLKAIIDNLRSVGIATVIASGNDGSRNGVSAPGCISTAVSVGSTTDSDTVSSFSNVASFLSLLAPGSGIYSSVPGGGFGTKSGTSMATPHVAGAWALLRQALPGGSVTTILTALQDTGLQVADERTGGTEVKPRIRIKEALVALGAPLNPAAVLESIAPTSAVEGSAAFILTVTGSQFVPTSVVRWNGVDRTTTYVNETQLDAAIPASDVATVGTAEVTVFTPAPGGGPSAAATFTVTAAARPDLKVTALSAPSRSGAGATISVTDTTANVATVASAPASTTRIYLSTDSSLDAGDVPLGSRAVGALDPGASSLGPTSVVIPADTPSGTYYLIATADGPAEIAEESETNNTRSRSIKIGPDLTVPKLSAPSAAEAGATVSVTDTTKNAAGASPAPTSTTAIYFSTNKSLDASDLLVGTRAVGALAPDTSSTWATSVTIPVGTAAGTYYLIAVADHDNALAETSEANNKRSRSLRIGPDLRVSSLSVPTGAAAGATISVTDTTKNEAGGGSAGASTTRFVLSTDKVVGAGDAVLGSRSVPELAAGANSQISTSLLIPPGTAPGAYWLIAVADADGAVAEGKETNNLTSRAITIQ